MEQVVTALWGLAAAVIVALGGVLIPVARTYAQNLLQQRVGDAAARVAGEIAAKVAADPGVTAATQAMMQTGVTVLRNRVPDAIRKTGVTNDTLRGMIAGEIGKLLAPATAAATVVAAPPAQKP